VQRGTTLTLTLTGNNLAEPTGLLLGFPARVTIPSTGNNGKNPGQLQVRMEVPREAVMGFYPFRLATLQGMSNLRLFCVEDLPQVEENATNHSLAAAQLVPVPCVVVGRADPEATDYFKFTAAAGQRLSFEVLGRRLGNPFDPQLTLFDTRTGRELPAAYSNDAPGLQADARLTYTFKSAGDYAVAVRDVSYRGGDEFWYRLRIGDFPCATTTLPLAVRRGTRTAVRFAGPNVEGVAAVEVTAPTDPDTAAVWVTPRGANGLCGWPVSLALSDLPETLEQEPNNEPASANRVPVPGAVTGRFEAKGDVDHYVFALKKGRGYVIEAHTHEHGSPTEVYMVLRDARGAQLQATNPAAAPRLEFTPPADGDYVLAVEHLHSWGGPDEAYRITAEPREPGFDLVLPTDRLNVAPGGTVALPVFLTRRDYAGPIELEVAGAPGVKGTATIGAGTAPPPTQPAATLTLSADANLPPGPRSFRVHGRATINGKPVLRVASVRAVVSRQLAGLPVPPPTITHEVALAVTEKPPFTLTAKFDVPSVSPGKSAVLTVTAARVPGFGGEIALAVAGLPPNATVDLKNIPAGRSEMKLALNLAPNAPQGRFTVMVTGRAKLRGRDYANNAAPVTLVIRK
jgi:hypothetical protein